jgi:hypothetical protein
MTDITSLNKYVTKTGAKKFSLTNTVSVTTDKKNITVSGTTVKNGKVIDSGSGKMGKDKFENFSSSMQKTFIELHTTNQKIYKAAYTAKFIGQAIPYVLETRIKNFTNDKIADLRAQGFSKSDAEFWGNVTSGMMLGELGGAAFSEFIKAGESADVVVGTGLGKLGSKLSSSENIGKVVEETEEEAKDFAQGVSKVGGRSKNDLKPDPAAQGSDHSTFKTDGNGKVTNYETYKSNPQNPNTGVEKVKRYDGQGQGHVNKKTGVKVETPHVHDKTVPGEVRNPYPDEIPK